MKLNKLTGGETIGKCLFIEYVPKIDKCYRGLFRCFCGKNFESNITYIFSGKHVGCGCTRVNYKHGNSTRSVTTTEYSIWKGMKNRCLRPSHNAFKHYGARGIKVCDRWLNSFENFLEDVGKRPSKNHSLDRYPNKNGNYEPTNVRWATQDEQSSNMRSNVYLTFNGNRQTLRGWSNATRIHRNTIPNRFYEGWTAKDVVTAKIGTKAACRPDKHICLNPPNKPLVISGAKYKAA